MGNRLAIQGSGSRPSDGSDASTITAEAQIGEGGSGGAAFALCQPRECQKDIAISAASGPVSQIARTLLSREGTDSGNDKAAIHRSGAGPQCDHLGQKTLMRAVPTRVEAA